MIYGRSGGTRRRRSLTVESSTTTEFPKYSMIVDGKESYMTMHDAGVMYDNGHHNVDIGGKVLLSDFTIRDITRNEEEEIRKIAVAHSESK